MLCYLLEVTVYVYVVFSAVYILFMCIQGNYILSLESSLSVHSYKYVSSEQVVSGASDSHVLLHFTAEVYYRY
jgi:hypothetical protein